MPSLIILLRTIKKAEDSFLINDQSCMIQPTVPIDRLLGVKNVRAWVSMDFTEDKYSAPRTNEKMKRKSWEPFWSYQLNSTANPAHLPYNWARLAKLAVQFSW